MSRIGASLAIALAATAAHAQTYPVIHGINSASVSAPAALNAPGATFSTGFKAASDVTMTLVSGAPLLSLFTDNFSGALNPPLLSTFVGSAANGTGNGLPGRFQLVEVDCHGATVLQVDFAKPIVPGDAFLFADVDRNEFLDVEAYALVSGVYTPLNLTGWAHQPFAGQMSILPNGNWPTWNPTGGTVGMGRLTAGASVAINEPGTLLWPDQRVDRLVLRALGGNPGGGTWEFTALSTAPEPGSIALLGIGLAGFGGYRRSRRA